MNEQQFKTLDDLIQSLIGIDIVIAILLFVILLFLILYYSDKYYKDVEKSKRVEKDNFKRDVKEEIISILDRRLRDIDYRITDYIDKTINKDK